MEHPVYTWIHSHNASKDSTNAWLALVAYCEGQSQNNKCLQVSVHLVGGPNYGGLSYQGKYTGFTFANYMAKLFDAYEIIERYRNKTAPERMVERIVKGMIIMNSMLITMAKSHVMDHLLGDWTGAVQYISTKVSQEFPPCT